MSDAPRVYTHCGLRIRSYCDLALPDASGQEWDVDIRLGSETTESREPPPGDVIAVLETPEYRWYTATSTGSGYLLRFYDCCEILVSDDLLQVEVRPAPTERAGVIPVLLAGTVVALLLTLRGNTILHASAVAIGGRALAFTGQSGRGKTTVAALLCVDGGAELVTDDVLAVDSGPPVTCIGGASELRLRAAATPIVAPHPDVPTRETADERLAIAPRAAAAISMPLAGIVVPCPSRTASAIEIEQLDPSTALFTLLSYPRVYGWRRSDILSRDFATLAALVNHIPVYNALIPWGPPFDPSIAVGLARLASS